MDPALTAAARALQTGNPLAALDRVALRNDAQALALRGVALAQLGQFGDARRLLRLAGRRFGNRDALARARCAAAEAEVALASRELGWPTRALDDAIRVFSAHRDRRNEAHAHVLRARRFALLGRVDEADRALASIDATALPPAIAATAALASFEVAVRRGSAAMAGAAVTRAELASSRAGIPALAAEIDRARRCLELPAARVADGRATRMLRLEEVEALLASPSLVVVDACRRGLRAQDRTVSLARRPVLFALLRALAEVWPDDAPRATLIERVFGAARSNDSHRARLRVEIGRVRRAVAPFADVRATSEGFALVAPDKQRIVVLTPPTDGLEGELAALLADGEAWSTSALALAVGASQRTVQRALAEMLQAGRVRAWGAGRAQRWMASPPAGITTALLLPGGAALP